MEEFKRILFLSDLHCGHYGGLTPPKYWQNAEGYPIIRKTQMTCWKRYVKFLDSLRPFHGCIFVGDAIEGKGPKAGGREVFAGARKDQAKIAIDCLKIVEPKEGFSFCAGTPYHTGADEQFEADVAKEFGQELKNYQNVRVNGKLIRAKHHISGTTTPIGGDAPLRRAYQWGLTWEAENGIERADIYVFAHIHRHCYLEPAPGVIVMTLPGLQAWTEFGSLRCERVIHWGIVALDIYSDGRAIKHTHIMKLEDVNESKTVEW